jgi:choline dehydrogenase
VFTAQCARKSYNQYELRFYSHLEIFFQHHCTQPVSIAPLLHPLRKLMIGVRWLAARVGLPVGGAGLGGTNHFEATGMIRSAPGVRYPDIQYHFLPVAMDYNGESALEGDSYQVHVGVNRPLSRGSVESKSADMRDKPTIRFNYLCEDEDRVAFRRAIRLTREIMAQPAFDAFRGAEASPGAHVQTDTELDAWLADNLHSAYHPCGTAAMGASADNAVCDEGGAVFGVDGLIVADASLFPTIPNGNINAPVIMTAEKIAHGLIGDRDGDGDDSVTKTKSVHFWEASNWKEANREYTPLRRMSEE